MDWNQLKEEAKKMGYHLVKKIPWEREQECLVNDSGFAFCRDGTCEFETSRNDNLCGEPFVRDRTISQMLAIMKALQ